VAFDYAAAHEHLVHGENGVLVPAGDALAFEGAAADLIADAVRIRHLGRTARLCSERIGWDQVNDEFAAALLRHAGRCA
jgi:glycosyltransferase involved in cell wall biosynthesis